MVSRVPRAHSAHDASWEKRPSKDSGGASPPYPVSPEPFLRALSWGSCLPDPCTTTQPPGGLAAGPCPSWGQSASSPLSPGLLGRPATWRGCRLEDGHCSYSLAGNCPPVSSHRSCGARTEGAIPGPSLCFLFHRGFQELPPREAGYQQRGAGGRADSEQGQWRQA